MFYGRGGKDIEIYLREFKRACIANGRDTPEQLFSLLPSFLEDKALKWYDDLDKNDVTNYDGLCNSLLDQFLPEEKYDALMMEVASLQQASTEEAKSYGERTKKLRERIHRHLV